MAAKSYNKFVYNPLPTENCIRLIKFDRRITTSSFSDEISFTMHTFELSSSPPYKALSYTWGDPSCPYLPPDKPYAHMLTPVNCNGARLEAQPNLLAALKQLQTMDISRTSYIWIDALCIDQENMSERGSQVQLMSALYDQAELVILWLGPEDVTTPDAFLVLESLGSVRRVPRDKQELEEARAALSHITEWDIYDKSSYPIKLGIEPITDR